MKAPNQSLTAMIYVNEADVFGKVEIVKSHGYTLLDAAAVKTAKQYEFSAALLDAIQVGALEKQIFAFEPA
jgi:hypothetical protein